MSRPAVVFVLYCNGRGYYVSGRLDGELRTSSWSGEGARFPSFGRASQAIASLGFNAKPGTLNYAYVCPRTEVDL